MMMGHGVTGPNRLSDAMPAHPRRDEAEPAREVWAGETRVCGVRCGPFLAFVFGRVFAATPTVGRLSRRGLRVGEEAAKPSSENGAGLGVGLADVAGRLRESVVGGGSVQFVDVLVGGDGGELW